LNLKILDFSDFNEVSEVANMFKSYIYELYPLLAIDNNEAYINEVKAWQNDYTYIAYDGNNIVGFFYAYIADALYCKSFLSAMHCYVKPNYRNSKAAYLLYNEIIELSQELKLTVIGNAYILGSNKVDSILTKFGKPLYMQFIKEYNE
jgi:hypothetical protein